MGSLNQIFNLGDDQMKAHFNLIFPNGIPTGGETDDLVMRCTNFTPPAESKTTYEVAYHGQKFEKTGSHEETKSFTLTIRLAKDWQEYKDLKLWLDSSADPETGARAVDSTLRTTILVQPIDIDEDGEETPTRNAITFQKAKIIGLELGDFDHTNTSDPMDFTATFIYVVKVDKPYL